MTNSLSDNTRINRVFAHLQSSFSNRNWKGCIRQRKNVYFKLFSDHSHITLFRQPGMYAYILYITKPSFDWFLFHVEYLIYWMKWQRFIREIVDFIRKYLSKKCIKQRLVTLRDLREGVKNDRGSFPNYVNSEAWLNMHTKQATVSSLPTCFAQV